MANENAIIVVDQIESLIRDIRGHKVLLDYDLAKIYQIDTKTLNRAVKRNPLRFPEDFNFKLTEDEYSSLRCQIGTLKTGRGQHRKYLPYAFTEHGAIMAATFLNSPRAVEVSVFVVRAFVKLRQMVVAHKDLAAKLTDLERRVGGHDDSIRQLVSAIRQLMAPPPEEKSKRRIGFARE